MDNLVEVTVLVPRHKLAKFYTLHGRLLKGHRHGDDFGGRRGEAREGFGRGRHGHDRHEFGDRGFGRWNQRTPEERSVAWAEGTDEQRLEDAKAYYTTLSDTARRFLDLLIDDERSEIPASELIEALGLESNRVLAGSLSSFGRKARRIGRVQPFGFETDDSGATIYYLPDDIAALFREVRG